MKVTPNATLPLAGPPPKKIGWVKIKHARPKGIVTHGKRLDILAPEVKITALIPLCYGIVAQKASDKDSNIILLDDKLNKLKDGGFTPILPPELKAQLTVICTRLDELVWENHLEGFPYEIETHNEWVKVQKVYKFPRSNTLKIPFRTSEMADKAVKVGLLLFRQ